MSWSCREIFQQRMSSASTAPFAGTAVGAASPPNARGTFCRAPDVLLNRQGLDAGGDQDPCRRRRCGMSLRARIRSTVDRPAGHGLRPAAGGVGLVQGMRRIAGDPKAPCVAKRMMIVMAISLARATAQETRNRGARWRHSSPPAPERGYCGLNHRRVNSLPSIRFSTVASQKPRTPIVPGGGKKAAPTLRLPARGRYWRPSGPQSLPKAWMSSFLFPF